MYKKYLFRFSVLTSMILGGFPLYAEVSKDTFNNYIKEYDAVASIMVTIESDLKADGYAALTKVAQNKYDLHNLPKGSRISILTISGTYLARSDAPRVHGALSFYHVKDNFDFHVGERVVKAASDKISGFFEMGIIIEGKKTQGYVYYRRTQDGKYIMTFAIPVNSVTSALSSQETSDYLYRGETNS